MQYTKVVKTDDQAFHIYCNERQQWFCSHGPMHTFYMLLALGLEVEQVEEGLGSMRDNDHNYAEFGAQGYFIFSSDKKAVLPKKVWDRYFN